MLPLAQVTEWRLQAPWADDADVEQDLIISRALVDLFNDRFLYERTAFRGGTALHKLVLAPATRYSEDIDLVFLRNEPIGPVFDHIRDALGWLDQKPRYEVKMFPKLYFRFPSVSGTPRRIKVELATREAFSAPRTIAASFNVSSRYFTGSSTIRTYTCEELLATKLRALLQRSKGRDLYDHWWAAQVRPVDWDKVYALFSEYWKAQGLKPPYRAQVRASMEQKKAAGVFAQVGAMLATGRTYDPDAALTWFYSEILAQFPA